MAIVRIAPTAPPYQTAPQTRLEYLREMNTRPRPTHTIVCGNPLALPYSEVLRMLKKYPPRGKAGVQTGHELTTIYRRDLCRYMRLREGKFYAYCTGDQTVFGKKLKKLITRVLLMLETGRLTKAGGLLVEVPVDQVEKVAAQRRAAKPPMLEFQLALDVDRFGRLRTTLTRSDPAPRPPQMTRFFGGVKMIGLPR